ncbi:MAG: DUF1027 domain-containing protein, partial [Lactobacillus sp.]|nr:DUF1027 domain-containing protein [Lactobacillus sp.]
MTEKNKSNSEKNAEEKINKFKEEQPLRHPLVNVAQDGQSIKINE